MTEKAQRIAIAKACGIKRTAADVQGGYIAYRLPDYLHDLNAAVEFSKHLASLRWGCVASNGLDGTWECFFTRRGTLSSSSENYSTIPGTHDHYGAGSTLALAICEAGLRALGLWVEEKVEVSAGK